MDTTTAAILVIIIFALIIIAAFVIYQRSKVKIKGPFDTGLDIDASNEPAAIQPAIKAKDIKSRRGGMVADDQTSRGVDVELVDVDYDVLLSSRNPRSDETPKDQPPA